MSTIRNGFFEVLSQDNTNGISARAGVIKTSHSEIPTPVFMPVGTLGTVKAIEQRELEEADARIILGNSYHLFLRPGMEIIGKAGGLHSFMNWKRSILTDSGGFQIFSLAGLKKTNEEGVEFKSHLNGERFFLTPEDIINVQRIIGSDIMMPLDECLPGKESRSSYEKSIGLTSRWEARCLKRFRETEPRYGHQQFLFSICQGGTFKDLRRRSIEDLAALDFDGHAIGGLAVGEETEEMYETVEYCTGIMPKDKPRYLMGVGTPLDLLECVEKGVDMFDCVLPTRNARHGRLYTSAGEISLRNSKYKANFDSPDRLTSSYTSDNFSLSYLRHLIVSNEILGIQLATIHNIVFYLDLMRRIRKSILEGRFREFRKSFEEKYCSDISEEINLNN